MNECCEKYKESLLEYLDVLIMATQTERMGKIKNWSPAEKDLKNQVFFGRVDELVRLRKVIYKDNIDKIPLRSE